MEPEPDSAVVTLVQGRRHHRLLLGAAAGQERAQHAAGHAVGIVGRREERGSRNFDILDGRGG